MLIDSGSRDATCTIAEEMGAEVIQFDYKGGWPKKRQWAMENCDIRNPWTLLLDADEQLSPELIEELKLITTDPAAADGYWITLRMHFLGRVLKHGAAGLQKLSLFKTGKGRYEKRLEKQDRSMADMEVHEHVIVEGSESRCRAHIIHNNVNSLDRYIQKHNEYSNWESALYNSMWNGGRADSDSRTPRLFGTQSERRRWLKNMVFRLPGFPFIIFVYYYGIRLGFLDGRAGLIYCVFQAHQYFVIKAKLFEKKMSGTQ
jgi:glycosyltransferase involved in cell wall biosynthesis